MKNPVTTKLLSQARKNKKLSKADLDFLADYYHRLSGQDYSSDRSGALITSALKHRELGKRRKSEQCRIDILTDESTENSGTSVINIITDDQPFLINSLIICLNELRKTPLRIIHPNFLARRDGRGNLKQLTRFKSGTHAELVDDSIIEAFIQFEVAYITDSEARDLTDQIQNVIRSIRTVVEDWPNMRKSALILAADVESRQAGPKFAEYGELLRWMEQDHFAFLGYGEAEVSGSGQNLKYKIDKESLKGVLRVIWEEHKKPSDAHTAVVEALPPLVQSHLSDVIFTQSRQKSNIHRSNFFDCMLVDHHTGKGQKSKRRVSIIMGFMAGSTAQIPTPDIPHIRNKTQFILNESNLRKGGYAYKELRTMLETLPRQMLFQLDSKTLYGLSMTLLNQQERRKTRAHIHRNICGHFYICLVYVPRDLFNSHLRAQIQDYLLQKLNASQVTFNVYFSESILTRIHYVAYLDDDGIRAQSKIDPLEIERDIQELARDWYDNLQAAAIKKMGANKGSELTARFRGAFPVSYQEEHDCHEALEDINILNQLDSGSITTRVRKAHSGATQIKLYSAGHSISLSNVLPQMENAGMHVKGERPYHVENSEQGLDYWINDFEIEGKSVKDIDLERAHLLEDLFFKTWIGENENDGFNELTLLSGLDWRQVSLLRAYFRYLKQIRLRYSENYVIDALKNNPSLSNALCQYFDARFNPAHKTHKAGKERRAIVKKMEQVATLDEDRILNAFLDVIDNTLRTNFYQKDESGESKTYISIKLDSRSIPRIPEPAPKYEIFVCSPRVEGVHLRGGDVARGGLRWSERPEDFRTEVLGLVKAQRVKNAVIVPVGSKGGFVAKQLPESGREEIQAEVIASYKTFISSLLDITDNLSGKRVIPPKDVVRHDGDDPYLVVAADKGTATFSDIANGLSEDYGFWLGDAFASGGSVGYDHKKMGITARGAWESVKRHFRELGKDIQNQDFTAVGIGDMGGDVFGNGMLLSKHTRLVAAFNHLHIFIDPNPDSAKSWQERKRLFDLPRSSWTDYDSRLISKGGGIYERSAKSITLSAEAKKALGAKKDSYAPADLINLILKSEVELLWNGGIGTYVKASFETHDHAQDRNNDSLRVSADELQCKVIGEGGNLGMTQYARIEYAQRGGLCYTDAIDNSAGVDTSDHEVNIKILLNQALETGQLSAKQRNALLARMENEVAKLVLNNNYVQTQTLSLQAENSQKWMAQQVRSIQLLDNKGLLSRAIEFLPEDAEIENRIETKNWFTRPELAVVLSYSKMDLYQDLLDSNLPSDRYLSQTLIDYFPVVLGKKYSKLIAKHRLKREIVCTQITNEMIGVMGPNFHLLLGELTGSSSEAITRAFLVAQELHGTNQIIDRIQKLDNKVSAQTQMQMLESVSGVIDSAVRWILQLTDAENSVDKLLKRYHKDYGKLRTQLRKQKAEPGKQGKSWLAAGTPKDLVQSLEEISALSTATDIVDIAAQCKQEVVSIAEIYRALSDKLDVRWINKAIDELSSENDWHEKAIFSLRHQLRSNLSSLVSEVGSSARSGKAMTRYEQWMASPGQNMSHYMEMKNKLAREGQADFAMLSVLVSELGRIS